MTVKIAFVNQLTGICSHVVTPAIAGTYTAGELYFGLEAVEIPFEWDDQLVSTSMYYKGGVWNPKSAAPTKYHKFDLSTETWVQATELITLGKLEVKAAINALRSAKEIEPLTYDGKILDADWQARTNISDRILSISSLLSIGGTINPATLIWRDADNVTHTWTDVTTFKNWLEGIVVALEDRVTSLYVTSWNKKDEVEAITDAFALEFLVLTEGW